MIRININSDKQNALISVGYADALSLIFTDYPGNYANLSGLFEDIRFSEASFTETDPENGSPVTQELNIVIRGQNADTDNTVNDITGKYLIMKLGFANGDIKIMGVPDNPVLLSVAQSGNPIISTISTTRNSSEKAKYLVV